MGVDRRAGAAGLPALLIACVAVVCTAALANDAAGDLRNQDPLVLASAEFVKTTRGDDGSGSEAAAPRPWQSRTLPDLWRTHGMADFGYGWYRLGFALGERPVVPWAIYVDFAQSSYSIRLNGVEVATDVDFDAAVLHPRATVPLLVTFPSELLRAGPNQLDVRLRVEQDSHGGLSKIEVGPRDQLESRFFEARFWRAGLPGALNLAVLAAAIFMLLLWARRPSETLFGWFSALALVWALRGIYVAGDDHLLRALHARLGFASNDLFLGSTLMLGCALLLVVVDRYAKRPQHGLEVGALAFCGFTTLLVAGMGRPGLEALETPWHAIAAVLVLLAMRSAIAATLERLHWPDA